jgi:carbamoyl-phosphate synthase small subunit
MREGLAVTADGQIFRGWSVGANGIGQGEVVFNTSMTGYQEVITDPSYAGQVVVMTSAHIGNYGVAVMDEQAVSPAATGLIVRSLAKRHSSWRADGSFSELLRASGMVALEGVDTRRLTRHIRSAGAMPIALGSDVDSAELRRIAAAAPPMEGQNLAGRVTTSRIWTQAAVGAWRGKVVVVDLGVKRSIINQLTGRGIEVEVVPMDTPAEQILSAAPDGVFLSNGPGDPAVLTVPIATVRSLLGRVPLFGICLGHQVLGLALGARTYKLPFGHHGGNHPVRRFVDGRIELTAHNHGFAVDLGKEGAAADLRNENLGRPALKTEFGDVFATHVNLNDGTLEGLACENAGAFSVQYHPEAAPGPHDALHYFDQFAAMLGSR